MKSKGLVLTTSVLVADALPLFSEAIATSLGLYPEFWIFQKRPSSGLALLEEILELKPDVALVDYWLPDVDGSSITPMILSRAPECRVILLSWLSSASQIKEAMDAGAKGFLSKDLRVEQLAEAVRRVASGQGSVHVNAVQRLIEDRGKLKINDRALFDALTPRQVAVLYLLDEGKSTSEIADKLSISSKTVTNHITEILAKTDTRATAEALAKARRCGFLQT